MIALLMGALALLPGQIASPMQTASRWILREDPAYCLLERQNIDPVAMLSIDTTPGSDTYRIAIASESITGSAVLEPASLTFAPSGQTMKGLTSIATLPDARTVIWMQGAPSALLDNLAGADVVAITTRSGTKASVPVTASTKAIDALRGCIADQLKEWGADAGQFAPGGTAPVALKNRDDWLSTKDMMTIAGLSGHSDVDASFRVAVSADGVIDDCQAVNQAIEDKVQKIACAAIIEKRLFRAAKDAGGRPVRGAATFRVVLTRGPS